MGATPSSCRAPAALGLTGLLLPWSSTVYYYEAHMADWRRRALVSTARVSAWQGPPPKVVGRFCARHFAKLLFTRRHSKLPAGRPATTGVIIGLLHGAGSGVKAKTAVLSGAAGSDAPPMSPVPCEACW